MRVISIENSRKLTIRLPDELKDNLKNTANDLGFTLTSFLRIAIFKYLDVPELPDIDKFDLPKEKNARINFTVNNWTYTILRRQSDKYNLSITDLVVYASLHALDYYVPLVKSTKNTNN